MGRLCSKHEENEQSIKRFRQSNWRKETTWKISV
jgi:hypothetical protein